MKVTAARVGWVVLGLAAALVLTGLVCLALGSSATPLEQVWAWLTGGELPHSTAIILSRFRLPRVLMAGLVGAALSICGAVLQGVVRNPLADPFILGVSGGAALGAVMGILLGLSGQWATAGLALAAAMVTVAMVLSLSRRRGRMETTTLVLTGVMVNAFCTAMIMFIISTASDQKLHAIMFWLYGDLSGASLDQSLLLGPVTLISAGIAFWLSRQLNLLSAGDRAAAAAGVEVGRLKLILLLLVSLLTAVTVSVSGLIGFVGLMIPHLTRIWLGFDYRMTLPAAALIGAGFMILADTVARTIISPAQLPAGVVTAALGAPFFVLLLVRRGNRWW